MNFFKEQEKARVRLAKFKKLFYLTVLLTAFFTALLLYHFPGLTTPFTDNPFGPVFYMSGPFWIIFSCTIGFIFMMSWIESMNLRLGGPYIASLANATVIPVMTKDVRLIRLRNVVEEMSIASGIIPPKIFIMQSEPGINAFAAGFTMNDAVIGISQGCLDKLTRDELQGVVAHEIGHIVNGDMLLNLQLMGYLFGLMGISDVGRTLMRLDNNKKRGNPIMVFGLGLYAIGFLGHMLGMILRLGISRGQEFAADARSLQYTRNADGLGGALKKILSVKEKFLVRGPQSHKISHFYFFYPSKSSLFATHPPLEERLLKINPYFKYSDFLYKEKKELKGLMEQDISSLITSSFAAPAAQVSKVEISGNELIERTLNFVHFISSNRKDSGDLGHLSEIELMHELDIILGRLRNFSEIESKDVLKDIKKIILSDRKVLHQELLCYILFKEALMPAPIRLRKTSGLRNLKEEIRTVLSFLSQVSSSSLPDQESSFAVGMNHIYSGHEAMRTTFTSSDIISSFEAFRSLVPLGKERLLQASQMAIKHNMMENFEEGLFLKVLKKVMGIVDS